MKRTLFLIAGLSLAAIVYSQEIPKSRNENPRVKRPFGVSLNLGGPTILASVSLDYFVLPVLNIEAGGGIWGYYAGAKYHLKGNVKKKTVTLYTGALLTAFPPLFEMPFDARSPKTYYYVYMPVGLNNITKNGYTTSIEIATSNAFVDWKVPLIFSLKFGYHFQTK